MDTIGEKQITLHFDILSQATKQALNYHHLLKALVYFEDAESDPQPIIYFDATWRQVKRFFTKEVPEIAKELIR